MDGFCSVRVRVECGRAVESRALADVVTVHVSDLLMGLQQFLRDDEACFVSAICLGDATDDEGRSIDFGLTIRRDEHEGVRDIPKW